MPKRSEKNYGNHPTWKWVIVYLILGIIVYAGVYYLFIAKKSGYSLDNTYQNIMPTQNPAESSY